MQKLKTIQFIEDSPFLILEQKDRWIKKIILSLPSKMKKEQMELVNKTIFFDPYRK